MNVVIPRPNPNGEPTSGLGKVFLEYADVESATKARRGLHGRRFDRNQVVVVFYPEDKFAQGGFLIDAFEGIALHNLSQVIARFILEKKLEDGD